MPNSADLTISALNALASSPDGTMTLADFSAHLETRHGSDDEAASDARSVQSRSFQDDVQTLLTDLEGPGYATRDSTGGLVQITPVGRAFIGR